MDSGLHKPIGIAIDYTEQRLYWTDIKEGIYYSLESTNLSGSERQVVYEGTHVKPFGVAVDSEAIYWTDLNNNILWMMSKHDKEAVPKEIRHFKGKPMGIITKNVQIKTLPDCDVLSKAVASYNKSVVEVFKEESDVELENEETCFNGGYLTDSNVCHCLRGFAGKNCEISLCHNYCVHGECYSSSLGYPQCRCLRGFGGKRCERDVCDNYCLNGGVCSRVTESGVFATCSCPDGFTGNRCEESTIEICNVFCQTHKNDVLISKETVICR